MAETVRKKGTSTIVSDALNWIIHLDVSHGSMKGMYLSPSHLSPLSQIENDGRAIQILVIHHTFRNLQLDVFDCQNVYFVNRRLRLMVTPPRLERYVEIAEPPWRPMIWSDFWRHDPPQMPNDRLSWFQKARVESRALVWRNEEYFWV